MAAELRLLTLNLWGVEEPLAARLRLVEAGARTLAPDVFALQEVREHPGRVPNQAATLASALGMRHAYAPATALPDGHEGVAILSRFPIAEQRAIELPHATADERRVLLSARLATPAGDLWAHATHLNYRPQHGVVREAQALAVEREVAALHAAGDGPPSILMGDFNARPESDEIRFLVGLTTLEGRRGALQDAWAAIHGAEPGWTWAARNPCTARLAFLGLDRRLDYIFVTARRKDGRGAIAECRVVLDEPDAAGVFPSDHFGLFARVRIAPESGVSAASGGWGPAA